MSTLAPIDPSVKIPAGVLAAAARADELHKSIYATEPTPAPTPEPAPEPRTEAQAPEAASPPPPAAAEPPVEVTTPPPAPEADWERRYKAMKGRYDAEVPRLKSQLQELGEENAQLRQALAAARVAPQTQPETPAELQAERLITPEEEADYGVDFLAVVGKKAQEIVQPYVKKIQELERQLSGVGEVVVQDVRSRMFSHLDDKVPSWREMNTNPAFLDWLDLPDLYSGVKRKELLAAAYERNDAPRVAAFFTGFLSQEAVVSPAKPHPAAAAEPQVPLESLAAPGRAKSAGGPSSAPAAEKPIFTRADISRFYADVASGKYRGREADKNRIESLIFEAEKEGRIR